MHATLSNGKGIEMKSPLWMLNAMLALLLLGCLLLIIFARPSKQTRTSLITTAYNTSQHIESHHVDPSLIYKNDIFATYIEAKAPEVSEEKKATTVPLPPTPKITQSIQRPTPQFLAPLALTLKGVMYSTLEQDNRAIIADNKTKQESLYKVGDTILDAEILYIGNNKVIFIRSNGQQETLFVTPDDAQGDPIYSQKDPWTSVTKKVSETEYIIYYHSFISRVQNLAQFIDMLDITTAFQKGRIVGCRIGKFSQDSIGPLLGLQQGDIVTMINNIPTTTTKNRVAIYHALKNITADTTVVVTVLRNGQEQIMHYMINDTQKREDEISLDQEPLDSLPNNRLLNTIDQIPQFAKTIQQTQKRDQEAMFDHGGRGSLLRPAES